MKYLLATFFSLFLTFALAMVGSAEGELMLVDIHGNSVWPTKFVTLSPLVAGLYLGTTEANQKETLLDPRGQEIRCKPPTGFELVKVFPPLELKTYNGALPKETILEVRKNGLHGLVDLRGRVLLPLEYEPSQSLGTGLLRFDRHNLLTGKKTACVFDMRTKHRSANEMELDGFVDLYPGGEDLLMFSSKPRRDGNWGWTPIKYGFCDRDLKIVIPAAYERCTWFVSGLAVVNTTDSAITRTKDSRAVFIDKRGQYVAKNIIPLCPFNSQGVAIASVEDRPTGQGLVNRKFEFVVEPCYESLTQISTHIFAAKKKGAVQQIAIDDQGKELYKFPKEIVEFNYFNEGLSDPNYIIASMTDTEFKPREGHKNHDCLFDIEGNVLIPPKYYLRDIRFGLVQAMIGDGEQMKSAILDAHGKVLIPFQLSNLDLVAPNEVIKTICSEEFDSNAWKTKQTHPTGRVEQFAKFLKQYDLIGMSLDRCRALLGKGDEVPTNSTCIYRCRYVLSCLPCVEMEFDHRVLKRWRLNGADAQDCDVPWYTENMVFDATTSIMDPKLVKKVAH